jgi:hypothetical protein
MPVVGFTFWLFNLSQIPKLTYWVGSYVGHTVGLGAVENTQVSEPARFETEVSSFLARSLLTIVTHLTPNDL